jgi:hypothetical protein
MSKCTCEYEPTGHGTYKIAKTQGKGGSHCPIHGASEFARGPLVLPTNCKCEWVKESHKWEIREVDPICPVHVTKLNEGLPCSCKRKIVDHFPLTYCYGWMSFTKVTERDPSCPRHKKYRTLGKINEARQCSCS